MNKINNEMSQIRKMINSKFSSPTTLMQDLVALYGIDGAQTILHNKSDESVTNVVMKYYENRE